MPVIEVGDFMRLDILQSSGCLAPKRKNSQHQHKQPEPYHLSRKTASLQKQTLSPYSLVGVTGTFEQGFAMVENRIRPP
jgi:hypothetical protein